jgi:hypothetical protein
MNSIISTTFKLVSQQVFASESLRVIKYMAAKPRCMYSPQPVRTHRTNLKKCQGQNKAE